MKLFGDRPDLEVGRGERVLAWATTEDGTTIGGTRDAFYPGDGSRIGWEQIERATWNRDDRQLEVSEVGQWGQPRREYAFTVDEPQRLLQLVRERVTSSVVIQRHVPLRGRAGVRVIARRAPRGASDLTWFFEYDEGIDPADPQVSAAAAAALAAAKSDVGAE